MKQVAYQTGLVFMQKSQATNQTIVATDNNENFASVTELSFPLGPGKWQFKFDLYLNHSSASGFYIKSAALFTGTSTNICYIKRMIPIGNYSYNFFYPNVTAWDHNGSSTIPGANTFTSWHAVEGVFTATTAGTLSPRFGKSTGSYTSYSVTCYAGSRAYVYQVE